MFKEKNIKERYDAALYIRKKTQKAARIFGIIYLATIGVFSLIAIFNSNLVERGFTAGILVIAILCLLGSYLAGHIFGSCLSWTYYWLIRRFNMQEYLAVWIMLLITGYVGIFIWLKYRNYPKKLQKEMNKGNL